MALRILLVNPPVYDFAAYDFWLKPYGLLRVGGMMRGMAELRLFDFLDRCHALVPEDAHRDRDEWGRGRFPAEVAAKPAAFASVRRRYWRFGLPRAAFRDFLTQSGPFDFALIQTGMTYWYQGVIEVLEYLRALSPRTRTVLGGVYATLCPAHARSLGADLVVEGSQLGPLWRLLGLSPKADGPALWEAYPALRTGVLRLTSGCPLRCTYCSVPKMYTGFSVEPLERVLEELDYFVSRGVRDAAFYDDALLYQPAMGIVPFIEAVLARGPRVRLHTPNALHVRFISGELARLMLRAGVTTFYLGLESCSARWQAESGSKVSVEQFRQAVGHLMAAGVPCRNMTAYVVVGHPRGDAHDVEESLELAGRLGIRAMLADFSPIPGTPDGEACRRRVDMDEPLLHNKTAFTLMMLGDSETNRLKRRCREINRQVRGWT